MTDLDLHDTFERATDAIDPPDLVAPALTIARRRKSRRRGATAAGLACGAVVAVLVATQISGRVAVAPPVSPGSPTNAVSPTPDGDSSETVVWPEWDPGRAGELPAASDSVAPALPDILDPPASSPDLADAPVDAAVAAVVEGDTVLLLGTDGEWRSVELTGEYPEVALSPAGTQLVISDLNAHEEVVVVDLPSGTSRTLAYPNGYVPFDYSYWQWLDEQRLILGGGQGWVVPADGSTAHRVPYAGGVTVDPDGQVLTMADISRPDVVTDWSSGIRRDVVSREIGHLASLQANRDAVVGTSYEHGPIAVYLADRHTLAPLAVLPVRDPSTNYGNGYLSVLSLTDDGTVLLRVGEFGRGDGGFRVVAWDPQTGDLSLVSINPVARQVAFADGQLRESGGS